jgi:hypothetical protein
MASTGDGNASASSPAIQREDDVSESEKARRFPGAASPHGSGPAEGSGATDEARRTLDRVARESDTLGASSLRRMGNHFSGRDAIGTAEGGETDPVELWGRRIGRALSLVGVVVLALWLAVQLELL